MYHLPLVFVQKSHSATSDHFLYSITSQKFIHLTYNFINGCEIYQVTW